VEFVGLKSPFQEQQQATAQLGTWGEKGLNDKFTKTNKSLCCLQILAMRIKENVLFERHKSISF
jgi:hypothetical protein